MKTQYPRYEEDYYGWIQSTALLLKQGRFREVDMDHLIEEIEDMGKREKRELGSRLAQLIAHLLKWEYQPDFRTRSWLGTIEEQRQELSELILDSPGLKSKLIEIWPSSYHKAFSILKKETPIDLQFLPSECPYTFEECMNDDFFPGEK